MNTRLYIPQLSLVKERRLLHLGPQADSMPAGPVGPNEKQEVIDNNNVAAKKAKKEAQDLDPKKGGAPETPQVAEVQKKAIKNAKQPEADRKEKAAEGNENLDKDVEMLNKKSDELRDRIKEVDASILDDTPLGRMSKTVRFYREGNQIFCFTDANADVAKVNQSVGYQLDQAGNLYRGDRVIRLDEKGVYQIPMVALFETDNAAEVCTQMERQTEAVLASNKWNGVVDKDDYFKNFEKNHTVSAKEKFEDFSEDPSLQAELKKIHDDLPDSMKNNHNAMETFMASVKILRGKDGTIALESMHYDVIRQLFRTKLIADHLGLNNATVIERGPNNIYRIKIPDGQNKVNSWLRWTRGAFCNEAKAVTNQAGTNQEKAPNAVPKVGQSNGVAKARKEAIEGQKSGGNTQ